MRSDRQSAVRLLQLMMVASLVLPAVLFAYASWLNYRQVRAVADERIDRSLDILHEQALKVFQTVERAIAEVDAVVNERADDDIRADQDRVRQRLRKIVDALPQVQGIIILDRNGHLLASSNLETLPSDLDFKDRSYFKAQEKADVGTYVSDAFVPRTARSPNYVFEIARRRPSPDGSFNGVTAISVRSQYFEDFYSLITVGPGHLYALMRSDGSFLARFPVPTDRSMSLGSNSPMLAAIQQGLDRLLYTVPKSRIDGVARRIGYRHLAGYPVYVVAATNESEIRAEWLASISTHLIFGLPATLVMFAIIGLALQRTRRLNMEAERREAAESALRQSQRLEAIGQLTGGVAHDFNNLLMVVSGSVQRLRRDLSDPKHARLLDMISMATERGEKLTRQLLAFSRRQMHSPAVIDLRQRLSMLKDMLSPSLRGDIEIDVVLPKEDCAIKVDEAEFELALLNLAVNARDAMPKGGTLSITARPVTLKNRASEDGLSGEFVAIRVADTGVGIPADILPRVFEPFFTTKEVGKGTGLGLSQVYGFAKQSGGTATVTSVPGRGTAITLFLPRTREKPETRQTTAELAPDAHRGGKVLLVEDNAHVAEVNAAYLRQLGYEVKAASSAQEALDMLENDGPVDLVFSDILMPGLMNGLQLAQSLRDRFPQLPVLLTTGYSSSAQDAVSEGFIVLQKPFDLAALERALGEIQRAKGEPAAPRAAVG